MIFIFDLENVRHMGMLGVEYLSAGDKCEIFYSNACNHIRTGDWKKIVDSGCQINTYYLQTPAKQALDFTIATRIGEIMATEKDQQVAIISNDHGYKSVVDYCKTVHDKRIVLEGSIRQAISKSEECSERKTLIKQQDKTVSIPDVYEKYQEEKLLYEIIYKETGSEFVFVTHYPSKKRPFYAMDSKENANVTESFDLLFRGLEITTGGQRIHTYEEQVEKILAKGMHTELFESYLMMHKYGMPPHGGLGLGLERFTCKLLGYENVRYATLFPRDINRLFP